MEEGISCPRICGIYICKKNKGYKAVKTINKSAAGKIANKASGKARKVYVKVRAFYKEKAKKGKIFGPYSKTITVKLKK